MSRTRWWWKRYSESESIDATEWTSCLRVSASRCPSIAGRTASGASDVTAGAANCMPITDAGSIAARSSRRSWPRRPSISALIVGGIAISP